MTTSFFEPGTLWKRLIDTNRSALQCGAIQPIPTSFEHVEDAGVRFLVRIVVHLANKPRRGPEPPARTGAHNPFLPYDPDLLVAEAGPEHVCLINKFQVVDHHLLITTRDFVHQDTPLSPADFAVWWRCLNEYESLGFYNGGKCAGASQPHRHMQVVPLPLDHSGPRIPIEPILKVDSPVPQLQIPQLQTPSQLQSQIQTPNNRVPFRHAMASLDSCYGRSHKKSGDNLHRLYVQLLDLTGISGSLQPDGRLQHAYNLLITRQWMILVPRRSECFAGISLNAMAFAGAFLTRNRPELDTLRSRGPMAALCFVAG
jgi:sulfate adenylyltransferase (ADP) / ATP adenylyltransferase